MFGLVLLGMLSMPRPSIRYYEDDMHTVDYDGHQFIVFDHSIIHHPECGCHEQ
jgi:hypothetical protein